MRYSLVLATALSATVARAQDTVLPHAVRSAADGITASRLAQDLGYLASDALRGRNTPSPGFDSAAAYIARRLAAAGVKPLGDGGTYFQHYDLREESVDTAAAYLEIGATRFRFGDDFVMRSFAGPISGTYPVVYVAHGWTMPARGIDPYAGLDVKGKLLLVHGPQVTPRGVSIRQIGRVNVDASTPLFEAQRRGAAGIIMLTQASAQSRWSGMRGASLRRLELAPVVPSAYAAAAVTSLMVNASAADVLLDGERAAGAVRLALGDSAEFPASFQLAKPIRVHVPAATSLTHRPYNVVAMIEGSDPALRQEYITIESHLDGAVGSATVAGDSIYNSADDNATGSAATLSIAEQMMKGPRPRRSLIFIWDSGEERGLWGTRHFVHRPPVPLERVVAHFNIDMIGANRVPGSADSASADATGPNEVFLIGPGVLSAHADSILTRVNRSYLGMTLDRRHDREESEFFYPRTDAGPFLERGVLTIGFTTGLHRRYHAPADEARYLDPKKMETIARTVFASVWALADAADRPRIDKPIPPSVPRYR
jgi:hypothetical protein